MSDLFKPGVARKCEQLKKILQMIDRLASEMEQQRDLKAFAKRHPENFENALAALKEARKLTYEALERLNFPEAFVARPTSDL